MHECEGYYHFFIAFIRHIIYLSNLKYKKFIYNTQKKEFIYKLNTSKKTRTETENNQDNIKLKS